MIIDFDVIWYSVIFAATRRVWKSNFFNFVFMNVVILVFMVTLLVNIWLLIWFVRLHSDGCNRPCLVSFYFILWQYLLIWVWKWLTNDFLEFLVAKLLYNYKCPYFRQVLGETQFSRPQIELELRYLWMFSSLLLNKTCNFGTNP